MWLAPRRWPFAALSEPAFPGGSPVWGGLAALLTLSCVMAVWKGLQPADLAVACLWDLAFFLLLLWRTGLRRSQVPPSPAMRQRPRHEDEIYHIRGASLKQRYPLTEDEILRLLHAARSGNAVTHNSIHVRLRQALGPDPLNRDVDTEMCALDDWYVQWCQSNTSPTRATAQHCAALLQRPRPPTQAGSLHVTFDPQQNAQDAAATSGLQAEGLERNEGRQHH
jgi:integrase